MELSEIDLSVTFGDVLQPKYRHLKIYNSIIDFVTHGEKRLFWLFKVGGNGECSGST